MYKYKGNNGIMMNSRRSRKEVLWMVVMMHPYLWCVSQPKVLVTSNVLSCSYHY